MKSWLIEKGLLVLQTDSGIIVPSAMQIFQSVIGKKPAWPGLEPGPSGEAAKLDFCQYPAEANIVVVDRDDLAAPCAKVFLRTQAGEELTQALRSIETDHAIIDGTWYPISPTSYEEVAQMWSACRINDCGAVPSFKSLIKLQAAAAAKKHVIDRTTQDANAYFKKEKTRRTQPKGIDAQLYPYQISGWHWLDFVLREEIGSILADEMGLGKTLQVISAVTDISSGKPLPNILIVAPGSLLENWVREFQKFAPSITTCKHHGPDRTGSFKELLGFDVVITSYDIAVNDRYMLEAVRWSLIVVDEAQNIKNRSTARAQALRGLPRGAGLAVTGTPIENTLEDLWSIFEFILPGYLGSFKKFQRCYPDTISSANSIRKLVSPLMLRRTIREVADDLPEKIEIPEIIELNDEEALAYEKIRRSHEKSMAKGKALATIMKLRQFCSHPSLLEDTGTLDPRSFTKFSRLLDVVGQIAVMKEKVLIFASFTGIIDALADAISKEHQIPIDIIDGRIPTIKRQPIIDNFFKTAGFSALVLSPKAAGTGLNITAANHVIHYGLEWNPAVMNQASSRAFRKGQTKTVFIRTMICKGTVEEVILNRTEHKSNLSEQAIEDLEEPSQDDIIDALKRTPI